MPKYMPSTIRFQGWDNTMHLAEYMKLHQVKKEKQKSMKKICSNNIYIP